MKVSSAVNKAMADGKINVDAENLSYWKKEGIKTNDDIVEKITDDMVNSIFFEVNSQMANAKYDNSTSYASKAANLYENLCDAINGADGRNVALKDILKNLSLTYAFEGDAKESATAYHGLIGTAVIPRAGKN